MNIEGVAIGFLCAITVLLFVLSLVGYKRNRVPRTGLLSVALGVFALKAIYMMVIYFQDAEADYTALLLADAIVAGLILVSMLRKWRMNGKDVDEGHI